MNHETKFPFLGWLPGLLWACGAVAIVAAVVYGSSAFELSRYAVAEQGGRPGVASLLPAFAPAASAACSGLLLIALGAIVRILLALEENTRSNGPQ